MLEQCINPPPPQTTMTFGILATTVVAASFFDDLGTLNVMCGALSTFFLVGIFPMVIARALLKVSKIVCWGVFAIGTSSAILGFVFHDNMAGKLVKNCSWGWGSAAAAAALGRGGGGLKTTAPVSTGVLTAAVSETTGQLGGRVGETLREPRELGTWTAPREHWDWTAASTSSGSGPAGGSGDGPRRTKSRRADSQRRQRRKPSPSVDSVEQDVDPRKPSPSVDSVEQDVDPVFVDDLPQRESPRGRDVESY